MNVTFIENKNLADTLQGRQSDLISDGYFKQDPKRLREKYLDHLDKLQCRIIVLLLSGRMRLKGWNDKILYYSWELRS